MTIPVCTSPDINKRPRLNGLTVVTELDPATGRQRKTVSPVSCRHCGYVFKDSESYFVSDHYWIEAPTRHADAQTGHEHHHAQHDHPQPADYCTKNTRPEDSPTHTQDQATHDTAQHDQHTSPAQNTSRH